MFANILQRRNLSLEIAKNMQRPEQKAQLTVRQKWQMEQGKVAEMLVLLLCAYWDSFDWTLLHCTIIWSFTGMLVDGAFDGELAFHRWEASP